MDFKPEDEDDSFFASCLSSMTGCLSAIVAVAVAYVLIRLLISVFVQI